MRTRPEYETCIRQSRKDRAHLTWCGLHAGNCFEFVGLDHAANSVLAGNILTLCPACVKAAVKTLNEGIENDRCGVALVTLKAQLDAAQKERDEANQNLGNLLAIIHRDGGQYFVQHGAQKAVDDAHEAWAFLQQELDAFKESLRVNNDKRLALEQQLAVTQKELHGEQKNRNEAMLQAAKLRDVQQQLAEANAQAAAGKEAAHLALIALGIDDYSQDGAFETRNALRRFIDGTAGRTRWR